MGSLWETRALQGATPQADRNQQDATASENALSLPGDNTASEQNYLTGNQPPSETPNTQPHSDVPTDPEELRRVGARQADYTRKMQELAGQRRDLERQQAQYQQQIAENQRIQAQLLGQMQPQRPQQGPTGLFAPEDLLGLEPQAREGLRLLDDRVLSALNQREASIRQEFEAKLQNERAQNATQGILRNEREYFAQNPQAQQALNATDIQNVRQVLAQFPNMAYEMAVRMAAGAAHDQMVMTRGQQATIQEQKRQRDASILQQRSQIGVSQVVKPNETWEESLAAVYSENPEANPETIAAILKR